jgi:hypothetical protein
MITIYTQVQVGTADDYERIVKREHGWSIVHACKEPYHRQALGYTSRGAPQGHPEYFIAYRDNGHRLILNMVDTSNPAFFNKEAMIDPALDFLAQAYSNGRQLFIHCNQGESRGPSIALLFLAHRLHVIPNDTLDVSEEAFRVRYPLYNPGTGIRGHMAQYWEVYKNSSRE